MNISINPFDVLVHESYLYDGDKTKTDLIKAQVIGVSTYLNQPLTFHILIDKQWIFSDLPITSFISSYNENKYNLKDLSSIECSTLEIDVFILDTFKNKNICIYFKEYQTWEIGEYLMSFDFYTGNELLHLIKLDNGQFSLTPNHKINWENINDLPKYKKNRTIWRFDK